MIAITTMMVVATIQSSINKMVPKTSYIKMIDIWLIYSFNIIIVMMTIHTYMDMYIKRDSNDKRLPLEIYNIYIVYIFLAHSLKLLTQELKSPKGTMTTMKMMIKFQVLRLIHLEIIQDGIPPG